jgi:hypothetical protein
VGNIWKSAINKRVPAQTGTQVVIREIVYLDSLSPVSRRI